MKFSINEKNLILELLGAFMLSMALFYSDVISFIAGFFGLIIIIDLLNTNLRRGSNGRFS